MQASDPEDTEDGHSFNLGTLCCLPKKPSGTDCALGDFFAADCTRPLCIVNTDDRLIANAARLRWEPIFNAWVSQMQRGFLHGRSFLANVIEIDYNAMTVSLAKATGALVLFDFRAAFPGVSHKYMEQVLTHLGLPDTALNLVRHLYDNNRCRISCQGQTFRGFGIKSGIRQGCPLSLLLFAVIVDLLLRRLASDFPKCRGRAFADDIAMVLEDLWLTAPRLAHMFNEFEAISGLALNLPKTVIIPLWPTPTDDVRQHMPTVSPPWADVQVASSGTYLGIVTGPGKGDSSWHKPNAKYVERVKMWGQQPIGLQYAAAAYGTFAASVYSFVGQIEHPPDWVLENEKKMLLSAASGPGKWVSAQDLWFLRESYGQARSFTHIAATSWASQVRVSEWEARATGCLKINSRARRLGHVFGLVEYLGRRACWKDWYSRSHILVLEAAMLNFEGLGSNTERIEDHIAGTPRTWTLAVMKRVKQNFQRQVKTVILNSMRPDPEFRTRDKLKRWHIAGPEAHVAQRVLRRQQRYSARCGIDGAQTGGDFQNVDTANSVAQAQPRTTWSITATVES